MSSGKTEEAKKTDGIAFEMLFLKTSVVDADEFSTSDGLAGKGVLVFDDFCGRETRLVPKALFTPRLSDFGTESSERCPVLQENKETSLRLLKFNKIIFTEWR